ncbi:glycoside hydrolase family 99-like domain-containing protein [Algoriphagus sp. H41]|uniref:Glycoside hydrolase family 99-like domain-containing protein n=1 Tax=Algoriphagus oliviformis TaxID=2811231 RepID=A0ABS3C746_9BACT|nr:glycoside hydrolase family 99-like domain-containing protein [Algoriphagus oliviformis]MBN7812944.1 glycoside hydrolase family 99-like domain-containing protein [Algoriphagus oliviformis]
MTEIFSYYLPQFHSIPENDRWWGAGFTEWTNVKKAKPLFHGHKQPIIPGELGYYSLDTTEILRRQALLANQYGVDGFVFYHYWFGSGKYLLDKPLLNFLADPTIDIQICICWANESWRGTWHGAAKDQMLQEQKYLGIEDYKKHFEFLLPFFQDSRCLRIEGMPVYQIYVPESIPDLAVYISTFNGLATENGLPGIYWIGVKASSGFDPQSFGIQGMVNGNLANINRYHFRSFSGFFNRIVLSNPVVRKLFKWPKRIAYGIVRACLEDFSTSYSYDFFPLAIPNWDNTPRVKHEGTVYTGASPSSFGKHLLACIQRAKKNSPGKKLVFIKSWNEWAEGNILEPSQEYGRGYLEALKSVVDG